MTFPCRVVMFASHGGVGAAAGVCSTKVFMEGQKQVIHVPSSSTFRQFRQQLDSLPVDNKAGVTPTEQTQLWKSSVSTLWAHRNSRIKISFKTGYEKSRG